MHFLLYPLTFFFFKNLTVCFSSLSPFKPLLQSVPAILHFQNCSNLSIPILEKMDLKAMAGCNQALCPGVSFLTAFHCRVSLDTFSSPYLFFFSFLKPASLSFPLLLKVFSLPFRSVCELLGAFPSLPFDWCDFCSFLCLHGFLGTLCGCVSVWLLQLCGWGSS